MATDEATAAIADPAEFFVKRVQLMIGVFAGVVAAVGLGALIPLTIAQRDRTVLVLVGGMDGDELQLITAVAVGIAVIALLLIAASALLKVGGIARVGIAGLIYAVVTLSAIFGVIAAVFMGALNSSVEYLRLESPDGRQVVVSVTFFTSTGYSLDEGSGIVYHRVGGLDGASHEPPTLDGDDFALVERDGVLTLQHALAHGGELEGALELE